MSRRLLLTLWAGAVLLTLGLAAANLVLGEVNQDEGWYLYAARLVHEGRLPYVDFAFTQGPVMTGVYASAWPLVERFGLAGGRLFTALLGLAGCAAAAVLAARLAPPGRAARAAALAAFTLAGVNIHQSYFTTLVKTYALAGLLLTAGFVALTAASGRRGRVAALLAGVLLALAAGTRTSAGMALPVAFAFLLLAARRRGQQRPTLQGRPTADAAGVGTTSVSSIPGQRLAGEPPESDERLVPRLAWLWFAAGAGATALAVGLPLLLAAPREVLFGLVNYHTGRDPGSFAAMLVYKAGFISRLVQAYFVAVAVAIALAVAGAAARLAPGLVPTAAARLRRSPAELPVWAACLAVTLIHVAAPFPYDDYQTIVFPLFAAAMGVALVRYWGDRPAATLAAGLLLLCASAAGSSPKNQEWFVVRRDRIWWPIRPMTSLAQLREAGRQLRALAPAGAEVLTQDAYLAVEAGLRLPAGLELGPFSYFPELTDEEAARQHVVNRRGLRALAERSEAPVAAVSGWTFSMALPAVARLPDAERQSLIEALERRYRPVAGIDDFGHAATRLDLYVRRDAAP